MGISTRVRVCFERIAGPFEGTDVRVGARNDCCEPREQGHDGIGPWNCPARRRSIRAIGRRRESRIRTPSGSAQRVRRADLSIEFALDELGLTAQRQSSAAQERGCQISMLTRHSAAHQRQGLAIDRRCLHVQRKLVGRDFRNARTAHPQQDGSIQRSGGPGKKTRRLLRKGLCRCNRQRRGGACGGRSQLRLGSSRSEHGEKNGEQIAHQLAQQVDARTTTADSILRGVVGKSSWRHVGSDDRRWRPSLGNVG